MSTQVKRRRGTTAEHASFTGALAEITIDTDRDAPVVHDGATAGGFPIPNYNEIQKNSFTFGDAGDNSGSSANALVVTTDKDPGSLVKGMRVLAMPESNNTGAATLQWGSTAATAIKKYDSSGSKVDVGADDLIANRTYAFDYDGTHWVVNLGGNGLGWTLLGEATGSNVSSVDFTSNIDSTYDHYMVAVQDAQVLNNSTRMAARFAAPGLIVTGKHWIQ